MSREEAAVYYLDGLLGFRRDYRKFREAADMLSEQDRLLLEHAVSRRIGGDGVNDETNEL
jgi:hypothetical protein